MRQPIAISLALTGTRYSPWLRQPDGRVITPIEKFYAKHMPVTVDQVGADIDTACNDGATFFHVHARNPETGAQYANLEWYKGVANRVRALDPQFMLSFPTSRKMEVSGQIDSQLELLHRTQGTVPGKFDRAYYEQKIRAIGMEALPDTLTTFTVPEVKMLGEPKNSVGVEDVPGWTDPEVMQLYYHGLIRRAKELSVMQEIEITTMGQFDVLKQMKKLGGYYMDEPIHFVVLLGFSSGLPISRATYEKALKNIADLRKGVDQPSVITVGAVVHPERALQSPSLPTTDRIHDYREVMEWVVDDSRVDIFRVGLEDTPKLYEKQWTNGELVKHAIWYFTIHGVDIMTDPLELRQLFGLPDRRKDVDSPRDEAT